MVAKRSSACDYLTVGLAKAGTRNRGLSRLSVCERPAAPRPTTVHSQLITLSAIHIQPLHPFAHRRYCSRVHPVSTRIRPFRDYKPRPKAVSPQEIAPCESPPIASLSTPAAAHVDDIHAISLEVLSVCAQKGPSRQKDTLGQNVCTVAAKAMGDERRCDECLGRSVPPTARDVGENCD